MRGKVVKVRRRDMGRVCLLFIGKKRSDVLHELRSLQQNVPTNYCLFRLHYLHIIRVSGVCEFYGTGSYRTGDAKMRDMKLRDMKMRHHVAGAENARHENAGHENARNEIVWNTACCIGLSIAEQDVDFQLLTFFLHLHKLCCQLCCQLCCTDYIFIIRFYSSYICHLKYLKNNNRQKVTPALKNRFRH